LTLLAVASPRRLLFSLNEAGRQELTPSAEREKPVEREHATSV